MWITYNKKLIIDGLVELKNDFNWESDAVRDAIKIAISSVISFLIACELNLESPYWASVTSIIVYRSLIGSSIKKGFLRVLATTVGCILSVIIFGAFSQDHTYYWIAVFIMMLIAEYKSATSKEYSYFWYLLIITFGIVATNGLDVATHNEIQILYIAFYRWAEIIIGCIVTLLVTIYIWPRYASDNLKKEFFYVRKQSKVFLHEIHIQYCTQLFNKEKIAKIHKDIQTKLNTIQSLSSEAIYEGELDSTLLWQIAAEDQKSLKFLTNAMNFYSNITDIKLANYQLCYKAQVDGILKLLDEIIPYTEKYGTKKTGVKYYSKVNDLFEDIKEIHHQKRASGDLFNFSINDSLILNEFMFLLKEYVNTYFRINLDDYKDKKNSAIIKQELTHGYRIVEFLGFNFHIHIPSAKFALKTTIMYLVITWIYMGLNLPLDQGIIAAALLTIMIPDPVSSKTKGLLRFLGCCVGSFLGIIFLFMGIYTTTAMVIWLFFVSFLSGYINIGKATAISYMGLQIGYAFLISALPFLIPVSNADLCINRFIGIFFGIISVWILSSILWPENYIGLIRDKLEFIFSKISTIKIGNINRETIDMISEVIPKLRKDVFNAGISENIPKEKLSKLTSCTDYASKVVNSFKDVLTENDNALKFINNINPFIINKINQLLISLPSVLSKDNSVIIEIIDKINSLLCDLSSIKAEIREQKILFQQEVETTREYSAFLISLERNLTRINEFIISYAGAYVV